MPLANNRGCSKIGFEQNPERQQNGKHSTDANPEACVSSYARPPHHTHDKTCTYTHLASNVFGTIPQILALDVALSRMKP